MSDDSAMRMHNSPQDTHPALVALAVAGVVVSLGIVLFIALGGAV
jgi:hypothetical protein